ncbi:MAG: hypothetical protein AABZ74_10990, partial [Cyanobacteriota bacterium]
MLEIEYENKIIKVNNKILKKAMVFQIKYLSIFIYLLLFFIPLNSYSEELEEKNILNEELSYLLEDNKNSKTIQEIKKQNDGWTKIDSKDLIVKRAKNDGNFIWLKVKIPQKIDEKLNSLFLPPAERIYQLYLEDKLIYEYEGMKNKDLEKINTKIINYYWKLVSLEKGFAGKNLYAHIYSKEKNIGFYGPLSLSTEAGHIKLCVKIHKEGIIIIGSDS